MKGTIEDYDCYLKGCCRCSPEEHLTTQIDAGREMMFRFGWTPQAAGKRKIWHWRGPVALALSVLGLSGASLATAAPSYACDINTHCYGIASYANSNVHAVHATISPINGPSVGAGNFATDEIWLVDTTGSYWVEVGYIYNLANVDGVSSGLSEFWFDSRPGGGAHGHVLRSNPSLVARTFYITQGTSTTYGVGDGPGSGGASGTSSFNSMTPYNGEVGSEITTGSGVCSWASFSGMAYSNGSGWVGFPSATTSVNAPQQLSWVSNPTSMKAGVTC